METGAIMRKRNGRALLQEPADSLLPPTQLGKDPGDLSSLENPEALEEISRVV